MDYKIIDAHAHLWLRQDTVVNGQPITPLPNGRASFMGEERQMLPPFMIDGRNSAEVFISNMDYARVSAAVITQEFIDGNQDDYLEEVARNYPDRFMVCGLCDLRRDDFMDKAIELHGRGFKALAIPGHRLFLPQGRVWLNTPDKIELFRFMEKHGMILSIALAEGDIQVGEMKEIIAECPRLKIAIAHFGMVTVGDWLEQIKLARNTNVMVESGGITWLFNSEFYPFAGAVKAIRTAADTVGWDKLMWGSDYPRTITAITYRMSYDFITKSSELTHDQKSLFLGENARHFYGFKNLVDLHYIKNMSE